LITAQLQSADGAQPAFSTIPLTTQPPPIGTEVVAFGYAEAPVSVSSEADTPQLAYHQRLIASKGLIDALYARRDSVMVTFPALQGDYPSLSGMSGGPILTHDGRVCGAVCTSADSVDDVWSSTGSLLPYLFAMRIQANVDGEKRKWSVKELAEKGIVATDGSHDKVQFDDQGDSVAFTWEVDAQPSAGA
jgi:hypothetical protein